jgi:hypothetical protein
MNQYALVNNGDQYSGQYVAVKSFSDRTVVSHGAEPVAVLSEAKEKGVTDPVLIFVPEQNMIHIY